MSEFCSLLRPPGDQLRNYDSTKRHDSQSKDIPSKFLDIMSIRESVFVDEQQVPLTAEYDPNDPRCFHWVSYASVSRPKQPSTDSIDLSSSQDNSSASHSSKKADSDRRRSAPTSIRLAVGTVRLLPPPHDPLPNLGGKSPHETKKPREVPGVGWLDPEEPYVKIGRLAVLAPYRRLGMGRMLMDSAIEYAVSNPDKVVIRPATGTERERGKEHMRNRSDSGSNSGRRRSSSGVHSGYGSGEDEKFDFAMGRVEVDVGEWKGLIFIHAQKPLQGTYEKWGFSCDEDMGSWIEDGIEHIGMWRRVRVGGEQRYM